MARRIVLIALAALAVLGVALAATLALVDVNRFKPEIERAVADRTGRRLTIDGELSLSLLPQPALTLPRATLSGPGGSGEFAGLAGARVDVALWPLLRGRLAADAVRIDGLRVRIVRELDGRTNIDDLLGGPRAASGARRDAKAGGAGAAKDAAFDPSAALAIGALRFTDAAVIFEDRRAGNTISATGIDVHGGALARLGAGPISLSARIGSTRPRFDGTLKLTARVATDLAAASAQVSELALTLAGTSDRLSIETRLAIPALTLGFPGPTLAAGRIVLDATLAEDARHATLALASPLHGDLGAGTIALPAVAGTASLVAPGLRGGTLTAKTQASISVDTRRESIDAQGETALDDATIRSRLGVKGFVRPLVRFELDADRLDLDRLLPLTVAAAATGLPGSAPASDAGDARGAPGQAARPAGAAGPAPSVGAARRVGPVPATRRGPVAASDPPIDLSPLASLDLAGDVRVGALVVHGLRASQVSATVKVAAGRADIAPINASLYGGRVSARAGAAAVGNRVSLAGAVVDAQVGPLLRDATGRDVLEGRGRLDFDLATGGASVDAMKRALGGRIALALHDGSVKGIDLDAILRRAEAAIAGGKAQKQAADGSQKTAFSVMSVSATVLGGVATSKDLALESPPLRVAGAGSADLAAQTFDYTAHVTVAGSAPGQAGRELDKLRGMSFPVRLHGTYASPTWELDWAAVATQALKARLANRLIERLAPSPDAAVEQPEAPRDAPKDSLRDRLRKLLR